MIGQIWLDDSVTPPNESRFTIEYYGHMSFFVIFRFYVGLVYIIWIIRDMTSIYM